VSISQPHHWPVVLFAPARESSRFQGIRPQSVYIKDQAPWPISVSNCIYDTYDLGETLILWGGFRNRRGAAPVANGCATVS
jgi:hypothetical protein